MRINIPAFLLLPYHRKIEKANTDQVAVKNKLFSFFPQSFVLRLFCKDAESLFNKDEWMGEEVSRKKDAIKR